MAFKFTNLGQLVADDPAEAHRVVAAALDRHDQNQVAAAAELGVHRDTLGRWLNALARAGHAVAGRGTAKRGRKPGSSKPEAAAGRPRRGRVRRHADSAAA